MAVTNKVSARDGGQGGNPARMVGRKKNIQGTGTGLGKRATLAPTVQATAKAPAGGGVGYNQPKTGSSVAQSMTDQLLSKQYEGVQKKGVVATKPRKGR